MSKLPITSEEAETLKNAYEALTRLGNETATAEGDWEHYLDRAHHYLALVIIRVQTEGAEAGRAS